MELNFIILGSWTIMWNAYLDSNSVSFMSNPSIDIATVASNGAYLFLHDSCGLVKIGTGFYSDTISTTRGKVYTRNADWKVNEKGWLACVQDKIYYRSPTIEPASLVVFNAKTLKVHALLSLLLITTLGRR